MNALTADFMYTRTYTESLVVRSNNLSAGKSLFAQKLSDISDGKVAPDEEESFDDMYYHTDYVRNCSGEELTKRYNKEQHIRVCLGENELPEFMDMVIDGLKNGKSLVDICSEQNTKAAKRSPFLCNADDLTRGVGSDEADSFVIDKETGEVTYAFEKLRGNVRRTPDYDGAERDKETVRGIADDLYTFLRYAAFPDEEDDPERVERLFDHIKKKQLSYSVTRFDPCFAPSRDGSAQDYFIDEITTGEKEDKEDKDKAPIDDFMETLRVHQEELYEREKKLELIEKRKEMLEISEYTA